MNTSSITFDGTNFATWKDRMKMHILGHNPAVWAIVCIGCKVNSSMEGNRIVKKPWKN